MSDKLLRDNGKPFRAIVVAHDWRGAPSLCIGAEGYSPDSFVMMMCSEEDKKRYPVGTKFDLVRVEEERKIQ